MKKYKDLNLAIQETFNVLEKYIGKNTKCLNVCKELIDRATKEDKTTFVKLFNSFLNHYFKYFHPLTFNGLYHLSTYYRQEYMRDRKMWFRHNLRHFNDNTIASYSLNIFTTFWRVELRNFKTK